MVTEPDQRVATILHGERNELNPIEPEHFLVRRQKTPPQNIAGLPPQPLVEPLLAPCL
jgi:hypothetical protein